MMRSTPRMGRSTVSLLLAAALALCAGATASTLLEVATANPNLSILAGAVQLCPSLRTAATQSSTAVTVFAPTNAAFTAALTLLGTSATSLLNNQALLCSILEYHIVGSVIPSSAATSTLVSVPTLLPGANITIQLLGGKVKVNDATVTTADVPAGASVVHIIDKVLIPPSLTPPPSATILTVASSVPDLTFLVGALSACPSLLSAASIPSTAVTVFAPTNAAFTSTLAALGQAGTDLFNNHTLLCALLQYHIVASVVPSTAATATAVSIPTLLANANITVQLVGGKVKVNDATVLQADVHAGASIVHIIDKVLLPPGLLPSTKTTLFSVAAGTPELSMLLGAVAACPPLLAASKDENTQVTVFAPNNKAFTDALAGLGLSAQDLLGNQTLLCDVLQYHIVPSIIRSSAATSLAIRVPTLLPDYNLTIQRVNGTVKVDNATVLVADVAAGASIVHIIDKLLLPANLLPATRPATIASVAATVPSLSVLVAAVSACPPILAAATNPNTRVTVFAPNDQAFSEALTALNMSAATLLGNTALLCGVLSYHIVPAVIPSSAATTTAITVPTLLNSANLTIQLVNGKVKVNNATVLVADVHAGGSIVHIIDKVLLPTPPAPKPTIASVASGNPDLSILLTAISSCPPLLAAVTNPDTAVTVFAPTNEVFSAALVALNVTAATLLGNQTLLCTVLEYHIVPAIIRSSAAKKTPISVPTLLPGANVTIQLVKGKVKVNDATVVAANIRAGPSIIHVINKVLLPPALVPKTTIAGVAAKNPDLSILVAAVSACPPLLTAATNPATAVTVFAPTDKAFATALTALNITATALLGNKTLLCAVLEYHIVAAVIPSKAANKTTISVPTLLPGANVTIQLVKGKVKVDDATVTSADIHAGDSLIHVIDQVLLPPFLQPTDTIASVAAGVPDLSTLLTVVAASPAILSAATNPKSILTVWAPTNKAFADALPTLTKKLKISTAQLLNNSALVTAILSYHVTAAPLVHASDFTLLPKTIHTLLGSPLIIRETVKGNLLVGPPLAAFTSNAGKVVQGDVPAGRSVVHVIDKVLLPLNWEYIFSKYSKMM